MENINEIKKVLYREKPWAVRTSYEGDYKHYVAQLEDKSIVEFHVPNDEAKNLDEKEFAQLLIRWLVPPVSDQQSEEMTVKIHEDVAAAIEECNDKPAKGKNVRIHWNDNHSLTLIQETCIRLGIPKSGNPELDALILESERKRIAVEAMNGILATDTSESGWMHEGLVANHSLMYTDELLKQLGYE